MLSCVILIKNGVNISFLFQLPSRTKQPEKDTEDNVMECDAAVISTNGRPGRDVSTNHGAAFFFNEFRHRISSWKLLRASLGELNVDTNTKAWFIKCFPNRWHPNKGHLNRWQIDGIQIFLKMAECVHFESRFVAFSFFSRYHYFHARINPHGKDTVRDINDRINDDHYTESFNFNWLLPGGA